MTYKFLCVGFRDGRNTFPLLCPVCEAEGELGVKPGHTLLVECPNKCGARFIQRQPRGMFGKPYLEYVNGGKRGPHHLEI